MRWGFGWELGPFEILDAIGARTFVECCPAPQEPRLIRETLARSRRVFRDGPLAPAAPGCELLREAKERSRVVARTAGASLVDLGDGVLAVEFHSRMNTLGADAVAMLTRGLEEAGRNHRALVIGSEAPDFSAGAHLHLVLEAAQQARWDDIDGMVRTFQHAMMSLKYAAVPVIAAPAGLALGGGCEIVLHADRVRAAAEAYVGLVETGVGLIPAGGGTKEMLLRCLERQPASGPRHLVPVVAEAFETIARARVSVSGPDALRLGYLRRGDSYSMNRDRLIADAKACALARVAEGYLPPPPVLAVPVGGEGVEAAFRTATHLAWRAGQISEHDVRVAGRLAWVLAGGSLPHATVVSEAYLLDLEREAFLSLCGEPGTLERIVHTLKTGKPLRN
jgi:3-hydroxyacyl-CoA dehydrogenase